MPSVVAVTRIGSGLGEQLLTQFEVDHEVERVVGVDLREPTDTSPKLVHIRQDPARSFARAFSDHGVEAAIHLTCAVASHDPLRDRYQAVQSARRFLEACHEADVETLCLVSHASAYGARPDNPDFLFEGSLLRPLDDYAPSQAAAEVEDLFYDYVKGHPDTALQIIRPTTILGAHAETELRQLLATPVVYAPLGADPYLQFVHEDDLTRAVVRLLKLGSMGIFNVTADGYLSLSQLARLAEKRLVRLPRWMLRALAWLGRKTGWHSLPKLPKGYWDFLQHPWLIAGIKIKTEAYFDFHYDTPRAFLDFLECLAEEPTSTQRLIELIESYDDDDDLDAEETEAVEPPPVPSPPPVDLRPKPAQVDDVPVEVISADEDDALPQDAPPENAPPEDAHTEDAHTEDAHTEDARTEDARTEDAPS